MLYSKIYLGLQLLLPIFCRSSPYMVTGFTILQRLVEESITEYYAEKTGQTLPDIELNMRVFNTVCIPRDIPCLYSVFVLQFIQPL